MIQHLLSQLPALQVVLPLVAAPLCVLLRRGNAAWTVYAATTAATFSFSSGHLD